jgi:hypothetical protein
MRTKPFFVAVTLVLVALACSAVAQTTAFYFTSSPTSWVGGGQTELITPADGYTFDASQNFDNGVSLSITNFPIKEWWYLDFAAPNNVPLTPGTYLGAARFPFQNPGQPGLSFTGDGRGDNILTGYFNVLEVQYGSGNSIISFAADFVQYDEGNMDWWNQGSIRFNSSLPIPEPRTLSLLCFAAMAALIRYKRITSVTRNR